MLYSVFVCPGQIKAGKKRTRPPMRINNTEYITLFFAHTDKPDEQKMLREQAKQMETCTKKKQLPPPHIGI